MPCAIGWPAGSSIRRSTAGLLHKTFHEVLTADPSLGEAFRADLMATAKRDPASSRLIEPLLYFKGFHALETYRIAHSLWKAGRKDFALYLQSLISRFLQVDIHPAAVIGKGIMFDHATGIVIGETAVIGDNCSMLHGVTLGGTGNEKGDRHPKIGRGVMIGAGAKILGNITVGDCARVAAGSVVLNDVPAQADGGGGAGARDRLCRLRGTRPHHGSDVRGRRRPAATDDPAAS